MSGLGNWLHPDTPPSVLVVGDLILDRYQHGSTDRISPEAPIAILAASHEEHRLGGCGNVAANLAALGAKVECVAVIGEDEAAARLNDLLNEVGVGSQGLVVDGGRPTIRKTRIVSQNQQLLRIDEERTESLSGAVEADVLAALERALGGVDIVVVSDYGKGTLTESVLNRLCQERGELKVLVDPKGKDYGRYRGATLLTPNRMEAEGATGISCEDESSTKEAAKALCEMAGLESVVITLGADGMYCATADGGSEWSVAANSQSVYDVTGAGDTVIGMMAFALAAGAGLEDAVTLANAAAGLAVQRFGVVALTADEVESALSAKGASSDKVLSQERLVARLSAEKKAGQRLVFTNGCFDLLHVGHLSYLREARSHGDLLIVGVNDDGSVTRLKGEGRPVNPVDDRVELLAGLECVSFVTTFSEDTPQQLIEAITPDVLVKGKDWEEAGVVGAEWVESHGGKVVLADLREGHSTTEMLEKLGSENES